MYGIIVLLLVVLTISAIIYLSPVDPAQLTQGQRTDAQTIEAGGELIFFVRGNIEEYESEGRAIDIE